MRDSSPNSILGFSVPAALVALLAMLPFVGRSPTPQMPAPATTDTTQAAPRVISPVWADFHVGCRLVNMVRGDSVPSAAASRCTVRDTSRVTVLIALLPDPEDSSLDWVFDAHLSSIRRAIEVAGFAADRTWMPSARRKAPINPDTTVKQDTTVVLKESEAFPGVMIFRDSAGTSTNDLLVVYVVGELPTAGVHKTALRNALAEATRISGGTLRILGPTFSGSAASLNAGLASWRKEAGDRCRPIHVTTGSATGGSVPALIARGLDRCMVGDEAEVVHATVATDSAYAVALWDKVISPLNLEGEEIAILVESNTGYGQGQVSPIRGAIEVRFPLNIASMRSEYARNPQPQQPEVNARQRARLPLSLGLQARPGEAPPVSSALTPPSLDILMKDMLEALRSRRVRAVGILATDVRDKIFLAELVRSELKDVLLFTFEGHALYLREDLRESLKGMVVVSSYPLTRGDAPWASSAQLYPFASDGAAGVFNAAIYLLGKRELAQQYGGAIQSVWPPDPPPIWITTIGSGSILPVDVVVEEPPADARISRAPSVSPPRRYRSGIHDAISVLVLLGGIFVPVIGIRPAGSFNWPFGERTSPPTEAAVPVTKRVEWRKVRNAAWKVATLRIPLVSDRSGWDILDGFALVISLLAFAAPFALLNSLSAPWGEPKNAFVQAAGWVLWIELVVYLALIVVYTVGELSRKELETVNRPDRNVMSLVMDLMPYGLALLLGVLSAWYSFQISSLYADDPIPFAFYQLRALQLDSGASGMLLLLVLSVGAALGLAWHRNRRQLMEKRRTFEDVRCKLHDSADIWDRPFESARDAIGRVRAALDFRHVGAFTTVLLVLGVVLVLVLGLYWPASHRTAEDLFLPAGRAATTAMLWTGLLVCFLSIVGTVIHLVIVWLPLSKMLDCIAETPLAPAFERIPPRLRGLGKLHIFDPPDEALGEVLGIAGHQAAWAKAHELAQPGGELEGFKDRIDSTPLNSVRNPDHHKRNLSALLKLTRRVWATHPELIWDSAKPSLDPKEKPKADSREAWLRQAEEVIAVEITRYVAWVLSHIRRIAILVLGLLVFTTLFLEVLPFPFHAMLTTLLVVLMLVGTGTVVVVLLQLAQDDVLSRITGSEPGKLNWNTASLMQALVYVALPLVALLSTEVAPVGQTLFGWVGTLLGILSTA